MKPYVKILLVAGIIIAAVVVGYFFFYKKNPGDSMAAIDDADEVAYNKLYSFLAGIDKAALDAWLMDIAKDFYTGTRRAEAFEVNGRLGKTGALLAAYASSYHGNPNTKDYANRAATNNTAHGFFYEYKGKMNQL